jgi:hypothetical protein
VEDSTRRQFLRSGGAVSIVGLTGCTQIPQISGGDDIKDTDGDGVIDSEDYAPRDASVQDAEDVREVGESSSGSSTEAPSDSSTETPSDQSTKTPSNPSTEASGDSITEGFEDGNLNRWEGIESAEISTATVFEGQNSLVITDTNENDDEIGNTITRTFAPISPPKLSGAIRIDDGSYNTARISWSDANGNTIHAMQIRNYSDQIEYNRPDALSSTNPFNWYYCELAQIDWQSRTIGEIRINQNVVETDVPFLNPSQAVTNVSITVHDGGKGSKGYFDKITVGPTQ